MPQKINILLLEDNKDDTELLLLELQKGSFDFDYKHCIDGPSFEAKLKSYSPDIIISDHNLPGYSGAEALKASKALLPEIPFFLVSGFITDEEAIKMIVDQGASDYILKDNLGRLNTAVLKELKNSALKKELHLKNKELNLLSLVAKQTHNGVIITDPKGRIEWVNATYSKLTGYSLDESIGKKPGSMVQGENTDPEAKRNISKHLKLQIPFQQEILNYSKTGEKYWIKLDITPVFDEDDTLIQFIAIQEVITERKQTEFLLTAVNDVTTSLLDAHTLTDISNTVTDRLTKNFGFDDCAIYELNRERETLQLLAVSDTNVIIGNAVFNSLELKSNTGILGDVIKNKRSEKIANTDEDPRYIQRFQRGLSKISVPIIVDGEVIGIIDSEHRESDFYSDVDLKNLETISNIIASKFKAAQEQEVKKQAQLELVESQKQLLQITSNIDTAVFRYEFTETGSGELTYVSPKTFDIFEVAPEDALENDSLIWDQIIDENLSYTQHAFEKSVLENETYSYAFEFEIKTPSGKIKWVETVSTISYSDSGLVVADTINKDITERKNITKRIEENEALLKSLTNNLPGVLIRYTIDPEGNDSINYISEGCFNLFEITQKDVLDDNYTLWNLVTPEYLPLLKVAIEKSGQDLSDLTGTYKIVTPNGVIKWISTNASPIKDDETGLISWNAVLLDVTKEKIALAKIIEQEEQLRDYTNNIPGVVFRYIMHPDGTNAIDYVSSGVEEMYGVTAEEAIANSDKIWQLIHHEDIKEVARSLTIAAENLKDWDHIYRLEFPNGDIIWVRSIGTPSKIDNKGTIVFNTLCLDVTTEQNYEQNLALLNDQLIRAQQIGHIGNWTFNISDQSIHWSEEVYDIYDRNIEKGPPTLEEFISYHDAEEPSFIELLDALERQVNYDVDIALITKKGEKKYIRTVGLIENNKAGEIVRFTGVVQNITDKKTGELELIENEQILQAAIQGADLGVYDFDATTGKVNANDRWFEMLGYQPDHGTNDEKFFATLIHPEDGKRVYDQIERIVNGAENVIDEVIRVKTKGGSYKTILDRAKIVEFDEKGNAKRIIGTHLDVTETHRLQKELENKQERLDSAIRGANLGVWDLNLKTNEVTYNDIYLELIGYSEKENVISHDFFFETLHPDDHDLIYSELERIESGGENLIDITIRIKNPNGEYRTFIDSGKVVEFDDKGKAVRLIGTILDITEQLQLKNDLEDSEFRLETAVKGADLGIWDANIRDEYSTSNKRWYEMFGYKSDEVDAPYKLFFDSVHPDDVHLVIDGINAIEKGKKEHFEVIIRLKSKSGEYITILDKGTALEFDSDGNVTRMIGTHLDITEEKKLQDEIQKSLHEKVVLLAEIHHRVKNNLAIVSGLLDLQAMDSSDEYLSDILLNMGQRIKSIAGVHELLYQGESFTDINLDEYLDTLLSKINSTLSKNRDVKFDIAIKDSIKININQAVPIGLLLNELITNSFKYAFDDVKTPKISFSMKIRGGKYIAVYSDNGPGIDPDTIAHPKSLGFTLINTLLHQLDAEFNISNGSGFSIEFIFSPQESGAHANVNV